MFQKIVVVEPIIITQEGLEELREYAKEVIFYEDVPQNEEEVIARIGDADGVLVYFNAPITQKVLQACTNIKYIGMSYSYHDEEFSNVDMKSAEAKGIRVTHLNDYSDEGVREYVLSELISILHGLGKCQWKDRPYELTGLNIGIIGMGGVGSLVATSLKQLGANIYYYSRTRKPHIEEQGIKYLELEQLLREVSIISTHLRRDVVLLKEKEFQTFGNGKIFINTTLGLCYEVETLRTWLKNPMNYHICDSVSKTPENGDILNLPNVMFTNKVCGISKQSYTRATEQLTNNIAQYFEVI